MFLPTRKDTSNRFAGIFNAATNRFADIFNSMKRFIRQIRDFIQDFFGRMFYGPSRLGRTLQDLRGELGNLMTAWEARGLDFRAPDGESPREVQARLRPFLAERAAAETATIAVCHRGVIRSIYAMAIGWDMTSKAPRRLADNCAQLFRLDADGHPTVHELDVPLRRLAP